MCLHVFENETVLTYDIKMISALRTTGATTIVTAQLSSATLCSLMVSSCVSYLQHASVAESGIISYSSTAYTWLKTKLYINSLFETVLNPQIVDTQKSTEQARHGTWYGW